MTISSTDNKSTHTGDGIVTQFDYDFRVDLSTELKVYLDTTEQGHLSGYSIAGVGDAGGGSITFATAPDSGVIVTLVGEPEAKQEVQFDSQDPFPATIVEQVLDKLTRLVHMAMENAGRAIQAPQGSDPNVDYSLPGYAAGKALMWNAATKTLDVSDDDLNNIVSTALGHANTAQTHKDLAAASAASAATHVTSADAARAAAVVAQLAAEAAQTGAQSAQTAAEAARDTTLAFPNTSNTWGASQRYGAVTVNPVGAALSLSFDDDPMQKVYFDQACTITIDGDEMDHSMLIASMNSSGSDHALTWQTGGSNPANNITWPDGTDPNGPASGRMKVFYLWCDGYRILGSVIWEGDL